MGSNVRQEVPGKKLVDAARHWARGAPKAGKDESLDDLEEWGAPQDVIEGQKRRSARLDFPVLSSNRGAVELFIASETQWRFAGLAGTPTGFDYQGVEAVARMMGIKIDRALYCDLKTMELAALDEMLKRKPKGR